MRLLLVLTVLTAIAGGRCANAGVVTNDRTLSASVVADKETLLTFMDSMERSTPRPIQVEQSDTGGLQGLATIPSSASVFLAALLHDATLRPHSPLLWRLRWGNAILPPSPNLDRLLRPS